MYLLPPDGSFIELIAFGVLVQDVVEGLQGRDIPLVEISRFTKKKKSLVRFRISLLIFDIHAMLLNCFGRFFLGQQKVRVIVFGIEFYFIGYL